MRRRLKVRLVAFAVACVLTSSARATADEALPAPAPSERLRMRDPSVLTLKSGNRLALPAGRFIVEPRFEEDEAELKRLQEAEVRLTAENKSLRASTSGWQPGWKTLTATMITGVLAGLYIRDRLD